MITGFVHLHVHSEYSLAGGIVGWGRWRRAPRNTASHMTAALHGSGFGWSGYHMTAALNGATADGAGAT